MSDFRSMDPRIETHPLPHRPAANVRRAGVVERTGTATDQKRERGREERGGDRKRRQLTDLLFDEIDNVEALQLAQKERLKRNIRAHLAMRARASAEESAEDRDALSREDATAAGAASDDTGPPDATAPRDHGPGPGPDEEPDTEHIIGMAAPQHPELPEEELEQNAILAEQLRECLTNGGEVARKIAVYLHLLLSIDGALAPHVVVEI